MNYIGIDLHKRDLVVAIESEHGPVDKPKRIACWNEVAISEFFTNHRPFEAVIEASSSYRWLYELICPLGKVVLAHPLKLRSLVTAKAKTDKLDAMLLAKLLHLGMIPQSYIPPAKFQVLRDLTRTRARLSRACTEAKNQLHALLCRGNIHPPFQNVFCKRGQRWLGGLELGLGGDFARDELLRRIDHYERECRALDDCLERVAHDFPETEALLDLHGIGLYSALLIVGELGEIDRFACDRQVGAYAGLTARVHQSGNWDYHGHISRQGSGLFRWVLVQAAMKIVRRDQKLRNFYLRIRKRSGRDIARVAVARKLAGICWIRLRRWHQLRAAA